MASVASSAIPQLVFVVLDAFPNSWVDPSLTPTLHALAEEGGRNREGGLADMTAATYPNHQAFVTGRSTVELGLMTNRVLVNGAWALSADVGPKERTIFDVCAAQGRRSVAVVGDQYLVGVCGAQAADSHWPPLGVLPDGTARNVGGYAADEAVVEAASAMDLDADVVFVQIDAVDGARHKFGATSDEAREQCRATDAALAEVLSLVRHRWESTVVAVVSDHDQEDLSKDDPIDLAAWLPPAIEFENQGTAALVVGPIAGSELRGIRGVEGIQQLDELHWVVWGESGREFASEPTGLKGDHGSPRTRDQVAIVAGGHEAVPALSSWLRSARPRPADWMRQLAPTLGLDWSLPTR